MDIGKLHEAAMFYLPSKRPDCFLTHIHEGRKPLDPCEWVSHIPDDLLISPPPPSSAGNLSARRYASAQGQAGRMGNRLLAEVRMCPGQGQDAVMAPSETSRRSRLC